MVNMRIFGCCGATVTVRLTLPYKSAFIPDELNHLCVSKDVAASRVVLL